jgi:Holliday junction resolvase RusA-like endonuclease
MNLTLPVPPPLNHMYANRKSGGRMKSREYDAWITDAYIVGRRQVTETIERSVVTIAVPENARRDLDGHQKQIMDMLVKLKAIPNDRCKHVRGIAMYWHDEPDVHVTVVSAI